MTKKRVLITDSNCGAGCSCLESGDQEDDMEAVQPDAVLVAMYE